VSVTVTRSGAMKVDIERLIETLKVEAVARILRRTAGGTDMHDRPFKGYSAGYLKALGEGGEDSRVDLRLTGGLLNSVKVVRVERRGNTTTIVIAPDTGTSPAVTLGDGKAKRTAKRGPPHNVVGAYIHRGTPRMPARPWLGLSPKDRAAMRTVLYRAAVPRGGG